jgi:AcrR family transcriptional regulator
MATGRPRRFEAEDEVRMLFDAALAVMERNGFQDAAVADILSEAGVSTRAFYRHFGSKDELLCALYRRDAEAAAARLEAKVAAASTPRDALEIWIDEILSFRASKAKAKRVAILGSPGAMRAEGYDAEMKHSMKLLVEPLEQIVAAGKRDGSFPLADPTQDARLIQAIVWSAAGLGPGRAQGDRATSREAVLSFCLRALGAQASR